MKLGGQVGCRTRTSRLDFGEVMDADPAYWCDAKCKLFSLGEVCALPGVVVVIIVMLTFHM